MGEKSSQLRILLSLKLGGSKHRNSYLYPAEKDYHCSHVVELNLQVSQRIKARVGGVVLQPFEEVSNHGCSGYAHNNGNNT